MANNCKSNIVYFQDVMNRKRLLAHGYLRNIERKFQSFHTIPAALKHMILKYFLFNEFEFNRSSKHWTISDDKATISSTLRQYCTIQFGQFFKATDKVIYSVTFKITEAGAGYVGVGFITSKFNQWKPPRFNNEFEPWEECITMYGNGCYHAAKPFTKLNTQLMNNTSLDK